MTDGNAGARYHLIHVCWNKAIIYDFENCNPMPIYGQPNVAKCGSLWFICCGLNSLSNSGRKNDLMHLIKEYRTQTLVSLQSCQVFRRRRSIELLLHSLKTASKTNWQDTSVYSPMDFFFWLKQSKILFFSSNSA